MNSSQSSVCCITKLSVGAQRVTETIVGYIYVIYIYIYVKNYGGGGVKHIWIIFAVKSVKMADAKPSKSSH